MSNALIRKTHRRGTNRRTAVPCRDVAFIVATACLAQPLDRGAVAEKEDTECVSPRSSTHSGRGNRHTSVSALIGLPFQSPVRIVVTLWRCPGLVGLYVFNPDSAPAAKPRQSGGGPLSKADGGLDRPDRSVRSAATCEDGSICCQDATVAVDSWRTQELHTELRAATDTPCPRQLLDHSSLELREAAAAR